MRDDQVELEPHQDQHQVTAAGTRGRGPDPLPPQANRDFMRTFNQTMNIIVFEKKIGLHHSHRNPEDSQELRIDIIINVLTRETYLSSQHSL